MSIAPFSAGARSAASPFVAIGDFLILSLFARPWLWAWLSIYPDARSAVLWAYHDEISAPSAALRWRRALAFFAHLPQFASAQAGAERDPGTATGGEPPQPPSRSSAAGRAGTPRRIVTGVRGGAVLLAAAFIAIVMWLLVFGTLLDLLDSGGIVGGNPGALVVMLIVATVPALLVHERRRFGWTPANFADRDESAPARWAWRLATLVFALLALIVFVAVLGQYFDALDIDGRVMISFSTALALAALVALFAAPFAYVVRRRYWVARETAPRTV